MRAENLNWVVWITKSDGAGGWKSEERVVTIPDIEYHSDDHIGEAVCKAAGDDADDVDDYYHPRFAEDPELRKVDPNPPTGTLSPDLHCPNCGTTGSVALFTRSED